MSLTCESERRGQLRTSVQPNRRSETLRVGGEAELAHSWEYSLSPLMAAARVGSFAQGVSVLAAARPRYWRWLVSAKERFESAHRNDGATAYLAMRKSLGRDVVLYGAGRYAQHLGGLSNTHRELGALQFHLCPPVRSRCSRNVRRPNFAFACVSCLG